MSYPPADCVGKPNVVDWLDKLFVRIFESPEVEIPTWRAISATLVP
jgi:hypothetical protein